MRFSTALIALTVIILLNLIVNRIAAAALTFTGMSREMARFQARSAFSLCGFTTNEAESVVGNPVRRHIISALMFFGSVGFVGMVSAVLGAFTGQGDTSSGVRIGTVVALLGVFGVVSMSRWVDDLMFRVISWALKHFTRLEVHDFVNLLQFGAGYNVTELVIEPEDWLVGQRLDELRLADVGVNILGIHRTDGEFVGTPVGNTYVRKGDRLIVYGARDKIIALDGQKGNAEAGKAHHGKMAAQRVKWKKDADEHGAGYFVTKIIVRQKSWLVQRKLGEVHLREAGVTVLSIKRANGDFVGAPTKESRLEGEDTLVVYGEQEDIERLNATLRDTEGEQKYLARLSERNALFAREQAAT